MSVDVLKPQQKLSRIREAVKLGVAGAAGTATLLGGPIISDAIQGVNQASANRTPDQATVKQSAFPAHIAGSSVEAPSADGTGAQIGLGFPPKESSKSVPPISEPSPSLVIPSEISTSPPTPTPKIEATPTPPGNVGRGAEGTPVPPPTNKEMLEKLINGEHQPISTEELLKDVEAVYENNPNAKQAEQIWSKTHAVHDVGVTGEDQQAALEILIQKLNTIYVKTQSPQAHDALKAAIDRAVTVLGPSEKERLIELFQINN